MDCSLPGASVHRISQARILEWVAISYSRGIFLTQGSNLIVLHLLLWQANSLPLHHLGSPVGRDIIKSGVWLATQKASKKTGWWKGRFALFWLAWQGWGRGMWSKGTCPVPTTDNQWARPFIGCGRGQHAETACIDCFTNSYVSVPGSAGSHFLRPVLRIVAACVLATAWSSGIIDSGGSESIRQLTGYDSGCYL